MRPFELDRRDGKKQRTGKIAAVADAGLGKRFLAGDRRHALAELGRAERLNWHEVDSAGNRRPEPFVGKARDAVDAGLAGGEPCPVVFFAGAERGDDAHAGDHHDRPAVLVMGRRHLKPPSPPRPVPFLRRANGRRRSRRCGRANHHSCVRPRKNQGAGTTFPGGAQALQGRCSWRIAARARGRDSFPSRAPAARTCS